MSKTEKLNLTSRIYETLDPYEVTDQGGNITEVLDTLTTDPAAIISYLLDLYEEV